MCNFLFIALPRGAIDPASMGARASVPAHTEWSAVDDDKVPLALRAEMRAFIVSRGMCGCDLFVHPRRDLSAARAERYRARGWSQSKIDRALAQTAGSGTVVAPGLVVDVQEAVRAWLHEYGRVALAYFVAGSGPIADFIPRVVIGGDVDTALGPDLNQEVIYDLRA